MGFQSCNENLSFPEDIQLVIYTGTTGTYHLDNVTIDRFCEELDYYVADVTSSQDYYPFGSQMPGRNYTSDSYWYGFNGKEMDNEVKGNDNSLDFGARFYDPRVCRWMSKDPFMEKYPDLSPYNFVANSPIVFIDPNGREIVIIGDADFRARANAYIERAKATDVGASVIEALDNTNEKIFIKEGMFLKFSNYDEDNNELKLGSWNWGSDELGGGEIDEFIVLAHEIYHAYSDIKNINGIRNDEIVNLGPAEWTATYFANYIRSVYGYNRLRRRYDNIGLNLFS
ncbi:MAG: RHS repeat-associated core domain-containing protein [Owenweeksia sp.]|nr:RHS repeat-associated core domain-containing protein [Owenweeksia sp.]